MSDLVIPERKAEDASNPLTNVAAKGVSIPLVVSIITHGSDF